MKSCSTFENDEIQYKFILSEKEAFILRSIMQNEIEKSNENGSWLKQKICVGILTGIDEGYERHKEEIRRRDWEKVDKEFKCMFW